MLASVSVFVLLAEGVASVVVVDVEGRDAFAMAFSFCCFRLFLDIVATGLGLAVENVRQFIMDRYSDIFATSRGGCKVHRLAVAKNG